MSDKQREKEQGRVREIRLNIGEEQREKEQERIEKRGDEIVWKNERKR